MQKFEEFKNNYYNIKKNIKEYNSIKIKYNKNKYSNTKNDYNRKIKDLITDYINNFYFVNLDIKIPFYYKLFNEENYNIVSDEDIIINNNNSWDLKTLNNEIIKNKNTRVIDIFETNIINIMKNKENIDKLISFYEKNYDKSKLFIFISYYINEFNKLINNSLINILKQKYDNIKKTDFNVMFKGGNLFKLYYDKFKNIMFNKGINDIIKNKINDLSTYFKHSDIDFEISYVDSVKYTEKIIDKKTISKEDKEKYDFIYSNIEPFLLYCIYVLTEDITRINFFNIDKLDNITKKIFLILLLFKINYSVIPDNSNELINDNINGNDNNKNYHGFFNGIMDNNYNNIIIPFINNNFDLLINNLPGNFNIDIIKNNMKEIFNNKKNKIYSINKNIHNDINYGLYYLEQPYKDNKFNLLFNSINPQDEDHNFDNNKLRQYNETNYLNISNYNSTILNNFYNISLNISINTGLKHSLVNSYFQYSKTKYNFILSRLKKQMILYTNFGTNNNEIENDIDYYKTYPGELIDLSFSHYLDTKNINHHNIKEYIISQNSTTTKVYSYNIIGIIMDLLEILYETSLYPWEDKKYEKRLIRLLFFNILVNDKIKNIYEYKNEFNDIIDYLLFIINNINDLNDLSKLHTLNNIFNKINNDFIIKFIKTIILYNTIKYIDNKEQYKEYLDNFKQNYNNCYDIYNEYTKLNINENYDILFF